MSDMEEKIRTPRQDRSIKTKEAIVTAAMTLFSDIGYHQTNSKQIAAAAGVSTGSFYSYFVDKREVFINVLKVYNQELLARIEILLAGIDLDNLDKRGLIAHLVDSLIASHQVYTGFHKDLSIMYLMDDEIRQLMDEQYDLGRRKTLEFLQLGRNEIKVTDLEAASIVVFESVSKIVDNIVFSNQGEYSERLKSEVVCMIADYLYF